MTIKGFALQNSPVNHLKYLEFVGSRGYSNNLAGMMEGIRVQLIGINIKKTS